MKVLIADPLSKDGLKLLKEQSGLQVIDGTSFSPEALPAAVADVDGLIVRSRTQVTRELMAAAGRLRVVGRAGAGVDNIDLEAATHKGVVVMNVPGGNSISVAEHAFGLLLALARKIPFANSSLHSGRWEKKAFVGQEVQGKSLGLVGLGKIGSLLAQRARAFQMKILAYDPFVSRDYAKDLSVELLPLEEVLSSSDFISLHLPLNENTRGLVCKKTLKTMKKGAYLINTARGELVVEEDLADALEKGQLAGAALDVFSNEPEVHPGLVASDRTILTPHISASTIEAQSKVGFEIARQVVTYLRDDVILNAVNFPSVTSQELEQLQPYLELGTKLGTLIARISKIRISEIGIRYYGEITRLNYKPVTNYILKAILKPILSEEINEVSARDHASERGISILETVSTRQRSYSNLISIQLRSPGQTEWVEGAILHQGNLRLVSVDGIPVETELGNQLLFIRNRDLPGVIGQVGTILGKARINIASFVLGRDQAQSRAVGVVNTDGEISRDVLDEIRKTPAVQFAQSIRL